MDSSQRRFRYYTDPACVLCLIIYPINRWYLKPHHIGGWFTHGYLNDVMCLPLFIPMILYGQRIFGLRKHDGYPRAWEIFQHWVIFSIVFQAMLPRFPRYFTTAGDPWDMLAYFVGGVGGWVYWSWAEKKPTHIVHWPPPLPSPGVPGEGEKGAMAVPGSARV